MLITLTGSNFGTGPASSAVRFGPIEVPMIYVDPGQAQAIVPPLPPGTSHDVTLVINGQQSNPQPYVVQLPMIASFTPHLGPGSGAATLTIAGSNFGEPFHPVPVVKVGGIVSPFVTRTNQGEILAQLPPGAGIDKHLVVQVGSATSLPSGELFSYLPPVITDIAPPSAPAMGGAHITITGANFGPPGTARELHLQPLGGGLTINGSISGPEADDRLEADLPPIPPGPYAVLLLVEGQPSNLGSYEGTGEPMISSVLPANAATVGGVRMTIIGTNFGAEGGTVILQGRDIPIPPGPDWTPGEIQFDLPEGDPGPAPIRVLTAYGSVTPFYDGFEFDPPVAFSSSPPIVPSMGGVVITIFGENFGTAGATRVARMGGKISLCNRLGHTELEVTTPSLPPGVPAPLELEINGILAPPILVEVEGPTIAFVDPPAGPTAGGVPITIFGSNFGAAPDDPEPVVLVGPHPASAVQRLGPGQITCLLPEGAGAAQPVTVTVGGAVSPPAPAPFHYFPPEGFSIVPPAAPAGSGTVITIHGLNFGPPGTPRAARMVAAGGGEVGLGVDMGLSGQEQVVCLVPPLAPGVYDVFVTIFDQEGFAGTYEALASAPVITSLLPSSGPTQGGYPITIAGSNFGDATGTVRVGLQVATTQQWSATEIVCTAPEAWSGPFPVAVERAPGAGGGSGGGADFTYDPPQITGVFPSPLAPAGGQVVTIVGQNFGREDAPRVVFIGGQPVMQVAWLGHGLLTVLSPPGSPGTLASLCMDIDGAIATCTQVQYGNAVDVSPVFVPAAFGLRLAGANPSRDAVAFAVDLPRDARWRLRIFDSAGRVVRAYEADALAGVSTVRWDGADARGARAPSGLYWARLEVAGETFVRKVVRL